MKQSLHDLDIWELQALLAVGVCDYKPWNICDKCRKKIELVIEEKRRSKP
jgi:hypothetical protein